ncbi:MAG: hypothetical protein NW226_10415 [Microscillaceae bacterium]|nr:hypothetical protein [Microscillaceae bacterium]
MFAQKNQNVLLEIHLLHNFFYNQQGSKAFQLQPSPETAEWIRKSGILIQNVQNRVIFCADEHKKEAFIHLLEDDRDSLISFYLQEVDPYWLNLTELPFHFNKQPALLYFSNQENSSNDQLHVSEFVTELDILSAQSSPRILTGLKRLSSLSFPSRDLALSLKPTLKMQKMAGWVDIHLKAATKEKWLKALKSINPFEKLTYYLQFQTRSVYWRYWFYLNPGENPDHIQSLKIVTEDQSVYFEGPDEILMPDSRRAWVYTSNKPLPIYERSPFRFELFLEKKLRKQETLNFGSRKKTQIIFALPVAQPEAVHPVRIGNEIKLCADIALGIGVDE